MINMNNVNIPFSLFDFFGYLFPGSILMTAAFLFAPEGSFEQMVTFFDTANDFKYILYLGFLIATYSLGHIVSSIGSILFQRLLIAKLLGYPADNLLQKNRNKNRVLSHLNYKKSYSVKFQNEFNKIFNDYFGS